MAHAGQVRFKGPVVREWRHKVQGTDLKGGWAGVVVEVEEGSWEGEEMRRAG